MPKTGDGKPDLSGIWLPADSTHFMDLAADLKPEDAPYQPWARDLAAHRREGLYKDDCDVAIQPRIVGPIYLAHAACADRREAQASPVR